MKNSAETGKRMKYIFRNFNISDYEKVYDFLVGLCADDYTHINWNHARWEWMFFHPEFDRSLMHKIGLWFLGNDLAGVAIYDHFPGEAFFAVKKGYEELETDILDYAVRNLSDENGLGIAVNDADSRMQDLLTAYGFRADEQTENILALPLSEFDFTAKSIDGIAFQSIDAQEDLYRHHEVLWKGFDHEGQAPVDEETISRQRVMLSAPHMNPLLHIAALNENEEFVAYCGVWYDVNTDYAYIEPVCTVPEYRGRGIAKALLTEALKRAYGAGTGKAYVISDSGFYKRIGFRQHSHYTFYWYDRTE